MKTFTYIVATSFAVLFFNADLLAQPKIKLTTFATGFTRPVDIANAGDSRLFIVEQRGVISIVDSLGNVLPEPFLDIDHLVRSIGNEQGLLGLAFHPDYATNGYFYLNFTNNNGDTEISRFEVSPTNPDSAMLSSELNIIDISQPYSNHNGGDLNFGPDGYLYIGMGDGGSSGDPQNRAQTTSTLLGKMLRIDVDAGFPYGIPNTNPFFNSLSILKEIWAIGTRNPWRFSFDALTGDMWIGDVGQNEWEEIDFEPAADSGGHNYGWKCYEGNSVFVGCTAPIQTFTFPVFEYRNTNPIGCSVTGGYVYRGNKYSDLYGHYLLTDYCTGIFRTIYGPSFDTTQQGKFLSFNYSSFGEDVNNELYVSGLSTGVIYRIEEQCSPFQVTHTKIDENCIPGNDGSITLSISGSNGQYSVQWDHGPTTEQLSGLSAGRYTVTVTDSIGCARVKNIWIDLLGGPTAIVGPGEDICLGDTVSLSATGGLSYSWSPAAGLDNPNIANPLCFPQTTTEYVVTVTDINNCIDKDTVLIIVHQPIISTISVAGNQLGADSTGVNYQWYINGVAIPGANSQTYFATVSGNYTVAVTDSFGCIGLSAPYFHTVTGITGIPGNSILIYPNPANEVVNILFKGAFKSGLLIISDIVGNVIQSSTFDPMDKGGNYSLSLDGLAHGFYLITIVSDNVIWSERIAVQ